MKDTKSPALDPQVAEMIDRAFLNGMWFGWNAGVAGNRARCDEAEALRMAEIRAKRD
jgi:hypothetical protein